MRNELGHWRAWKDIAMRALATAYQAGFAVLIASGLSESIADVAVWQRAGVAALAGLLGFVQRVAQRILDEPET